MHPNHAYQPPGPVAASSNNNNDVWDELEHQEAQEVRQHYNNNNSYIFPPPPRHAPISSQRPRREIASNLVTHPLQQAWEQGRKVVQKEWQAFQQQQQQQRYEQVPGGRNTHGNGSHLLDEEAERELDLQFGLIQNDHLQQEQQPEPKHVVDELLEPAAAATAENDFVMLPSRQRFRPRQEGWGGVANLDVFLVDLYQYYYARGWMPLLCQSILDLFTLGITFGLSIFLLAYLDWAKLATCRDEETCAHSVSDYVFSRFAQGHGRIMQGLLYGYALFFGVYFGLQVWATQQKLIHAWNTKHIVENKLGISARQLQGGSLDWDQVVQKLLAVQAEGSFRFVVPTTAPAERTAASSSTPENSAAAPADATPPTNTNCIPNHASLDALQVAQRIMRKENYLVALWNQNLLNCEIRGRVYYCPTLEWSLYFCVLNYMFNHKMQVRPAFYLDPVSLKKRFRLCALLHLIFMPFVLLFIIIHFGLGHAYDYSKKSKSQQQALLEKVWTRHAVWTFREFNELPHVLEARLQSATTAGQAYLALFGSPEWVVALGRAILFVASAAGGILVVLLAGLNDAILLHVQFGGRNLLWYAGMAGVVYSLGSALAPPTATRRLVTRNLFQDMNVALQNLATHTHYYPQLWKNRGWDPIVHSAVTKLMDVKAKLLALELLAVLLAPYILWVNWAADAENICAFVLATKHRMVGVPGGGDVCGFSTFLFQTFGDDDQDWNGKQQETGGVQNGESLADSILRTGNVQTATEMHPKPRARHGKMEKSFFSFQSAHPSWQCPTETGGQSLWNRVEEYRQAALARERELHIAAATRQLETLARLEQDFAAASSLQQQPPMTSHHFDPSHTQMPAATNQSVPPPLPTPSSNPSPMPKLQPRKPANRDVDHSQLSSSRSNLMRPTVGDRQSHSQVEHEAAAVAASSPPEYFASPAVASSLMQADAVEDSILGTHSLPNASVAEGNSNRRAERQYLWLERFHAHVAAQEGRASGLQEGEVPPTSFHSMV